MPFDERWFIQDDVIYVRVYGDFTLEQTEEMVGALLHKTETSPAALVHVLLNIHDLTSFPRNLSALHKITRPHLTHPRYGWALAYGQRTPLIHFVGNTLMQMTRTRFRMFNNEAEALEMVTMLYPALKEKMAQSGSGKPE